MRSARPQLRRTCVAIRPAVYALWSLPLAMGSVALRLRVPRRMFGESVAPRPRSALRAGVHSVLSGGVGMVAWIVLALALLALIRGLAYPLLTGGDYANSRGGPTLAGAWAVHALLGVGLLPVWAVVLSGLGAIQRQLTRSLLGRAGPRWPVPAAIVLSISAALLFIAWLHQL